MFIPIRAALRGILTVAMLVIPLCAWSGNTQCERPARLRYSMVPEGDVDKDMALIQPLLDRLGAALGIPVEVIVPRSYGAVIEMLLAGEVDLARLGPSSFLAAKKSNAGITAFATISLHFGPFQEQGPYYQSLLVVRAGSQYASPADLRGTRLALVDPNSTSGNKIPRKTFRQSTGEPLDKWFSRIAYAGSHTAAIGMVLDGRADAAFASSLQLSGMVTSGALKQSQVRVLWRSAPVPMDPFVYRTRLCKDVQERIRDAFLSSAANNSEVLSSMKALRFLPIQDSDYDILKDLQ